MICYFPTLSVETKTSHPLLEFFPTSSKFYGCFRLYNLNLTRPVPLVGIELLWGGTECLDCLEDKDTE